MRWLDGITDSVNMSLSKLKEMVKDREVWDAEVLVATKSLTWLSDWIDRRVTALDVHLSLHYPQKETENWITEQI